MAQLPTGPGDWPQWRGPNRDGVSQEKGLLKEWPSQGPPVVWQVDTVGIGYSALAIKDGRIFTQGDIDGVEQIIALSVKDGSTLWSVQPGPVGHLLASRVSGEIRRLDKNSDGVLDEAEALAGLGPKFNDFDQPLADGDAVAIAAARAEKLFAQLDTDHDGKLSFAEAGSRLRDTFAKIDSADPAADAAKLAKERTKEVFKKFDKDGDGQLKRAETRGSSLDEPFGRADEKLPATGKGDDVLTPAEAEAYLLRSEHGFDGQITLDELKAYDLQHYANKNGNLTVAELRSYFGGYRNGMGDGPRGTPTVDGTRLYTEGGNGDVTCLDTATGKTIWHVDLVKDFGGGRPGWGYSESPLVERELVIVTPGGPKGTIVALDKQEGRLVWQSSGLKEGAHYSSPVVANISGVRQIVQFGQKSVFGVTLDAGRLLWNYSGANNGTANCSTPIVFGDNVFASSAYGTGGGLAHISGNSQEQQAEQVYFAKKMANHHGGMVLIDGTLYGFGNGGLIAMDYLTGKIHWVNRSVAKGSLTAADRMLYCLGEGFQVALVEATPEAHREHGRFKIDDLGRPSWAHPVVAGGRFYIRNEQRLTAYDVQQK